MDFTNKWRQLFKVQIFGIRMRSDRRAIVGARVVVGGGRPILQLLPSVDSSNKTK